MKLHSPDFGHNQSIPKKFTCDGADVSPELDYRRNTGSRPKPGFDCG